MYGRDEGVTFNKSHFRYVFAKDHGNDWTRSEVTPAVEEVVSFTRKYKGKLGFIWFSFIQLHRKQNSGKFGKTVYAKLVSFLSCSYVTLFSSGREASIEDNLRWRYVMCKHVGLDFCHAYIEDDLFSSLLDQYSYNPRRLIALRVLVNWRRTESRICIFFVRSELRFLTPAVLLVGKLVYLSVMKYFKVNNGDYVLSMRCWTWKQNSTPYCIVEQFWFREDFEFKGMNCSFACCIARFYL